jgi:hypothetical protein
MGRILAEQDLPSAGLGAPKLNNPGHVADCHHRAIACEGHRLDRRRAFENAPH